MKEAAGFASAEEQVAENAAAEEAAEEDEAADAEAEAESPSSCDSSLPVGRRGGGAGQRGVSADYEAALAQSLGQQAR